MQFVTAAFSISKLDPALTVLASMKFVSRGTDGCCANPQLWKYIMTKHSKDKYGYFKLNMVKSNRKAIDALDEIREVAASMGELAAKERPLRDQGLHLTYEVIGRCLANRQERQVVTKSLGLQKGRKPFRAKLLNTLLKTRLNVDKSAASRMASCLRWAMLEKVSVADFPDHFAKSGGIEGGAKKFRAWKKARVTGSDPAPSPLKLVMGSKEMVKLTKRKRKFTLVCAWRDHGKTIELLKIRRPRKRRFGLAKRA